MTLWEELNYRGLVKDVAGEDIGKKLDNLDSSDKPKISKIHSYFR